MVLSYLLAFCRSAIGLTFAIAYVAKAKDVARFAETIRNFDLLPRQLAGIAAVLFLSGEAIVVLLLILGGQFLSLGFALSGLLLTLFTLALLSALVRDIQTSCNCFGTSEKPITYYDVWRNAGFIAFSVLGWWLATQAPMTAKHQTWVELALLSFLATIFVVVWTQLGEVATLLANQE